MVITLEQLVADFADALVEIDRCGVPFKQFRPGVGPYGEPQLVRAVAETLRTRQNYPERVQTKRVPDLLVAGFWAVEVKITRPFGDNGKQAENWSVNLLHPYPGNTSVIGDCLKLQQWPGPERRAALVIGYEHSPPEINLDPLLASFEAIAVSVLHVGLSPRVETTRSGLCHPVHQQLRVVAWEVSPRDTAKCGVQLHESP